MYKRLINIDGYIKHKSVFLLGPRQTGKSTYLRRNFPKALYIDLLESETFRSLSRSPESLRELVPAQQELVIVDEVQKLPNLLNEVQLMLDRNKSLRFILTGSSARKLKRGHANLLGGRALFFHLFPLVSQEVGYDRLLERIDKGSLPAILDSAIPYEELRSYVGTYLREEIQAEGLTRSIENFSRFIDFCAHFNGQQMNYTKIGNDAEIAPRTIKDYVQILEDTLVGYKLPPYKISRGRKTVATEKFYFFDVGVANTLLGRSKISSGTPDFGQALEHLVFLELKSYISYKRLNQKISYWRTKSQLEVDFIVADDIAIEVKGAGRVGNVDLKGLVALSEDTPLKRKIVVCMEKHFRRVDNNIEIIPAPQFFKQLWDGEILVG